MSEEKMIATTESVCPQCLKVIPAHRVSLDGEVYLVKKCMQHGDFRTLIWSGEPAYQDWGNARIPVPMKNPVTQVEKGCPYDCGLCPQHRQQTCCVLLEITGDCNLYCPICFASAAAAQNHNPTLAEIRDWFHWLLDHGGPYNLQLSGGEPTVRDDLPAIVALARQLGFHYLQLNTNGLRLAREPDLALKLKEAGLNSVFLQFDGTTDEIYQKIRGRKLLQDKMAAIDHCALAGLGIVLVPTLVPGVNMDNLGAIIRLAIGRLPHIRGVHFQPISYFGRYPAAPPVRRITIPDILRNLELQTGGLVKTDNFLPAGAENAYCTFHGNFISMTDGELKPWSSFHRYKATTMEPIDPRLGIQKSRSFIARQWSAPAKPAPCCNKTGDASGFDDLLARITGYTLSISGMAFQDAWNLDLDRLRDCKLHVFSPPGRLIPFCAYNLTAQNGQSIYRP